MANNPFDVSSFNLLEFAKTYGDMMDPKNPKDIAIATKNIDGGVVTRVLPNIAKMYDTIKNQFRSNRNKLINGKMWLRERIETGNLDNSTKCTLDRWINQSEGLCGVAEQSMYMPIGKSLFRNTKPFENAKLVAYVLAGDRSLKDITGNTTWHTNKDNWTTVGPYGDSKIFDNATGMYSDDLKKYLNSKKMSVTMRFKIKDTTNDSNILFNIGGQILEVELRSNIPYEASGDSWAWRNILSSNDEHNKRLAPQRWYHLSAVWDGDSGIVKIYLDGKLVLTRKNKPQSATPNRIGIGARYDNKDKKPSSHFYGEIQDVKFYKGLLSEDEVIKDYLNNSEYIPMPCMLSTVGHLYKTTYNKFGFGQLLEGKDSYEILGNHKKAYLSFMFASNRNGKFTSMVKLLNPTRRESIVKTFEYNGNGKPQLIVLEFDISKFKYLPAPNNKEGLTIWPVRTGTIDMVSRDGYYDKSVNNVKGNVIFKQGDYYAITNVQFEVDIPTVFEEIPYEVDKKRAQRYFEKKYVTAIYKGADDFFMDLHYEEKRVIPKITGYSTYDLKKNTMRSHSTSGDDHKNVDFRVLSYAPATKHNTLVGNNGFTPKSSNDAVLSSLVTINADFI